MTDVAGVIDSISNEQNLLDEKEERAAKFIPEGTYEGTVLSWDKVDESKKKPESTYIGIPQYNVGVTLYDCPIIGEKKIGWFTMTTHKLLNEKGNPRAAYKSASGLYKALGLFDKPIGDVLDQAKVTRLRYRVGAFKNDKDENVNFLQGVSVIK